MPKPIRQSSPQPQPAPAPAPPLALALRHLFPGIDLDADCLLADDGDGPRIVRWARPEPQPTPAELAAVVIPAPVLTLTARQMRLWLLSAGLGDEAVRARLAAIPDATQRAASLIEWEYSVEIHSNHPLVLSIGAALGLSGAQLRAAFTAGAKL